jgi:outer membrane lipoprotein LolB
MSTREEAGTPAFSLSVLSARNMKLRRAPFLALVASLCAACAAPAPRPSADRIEALWVAHEAATRPLSHWELRGRLAVQADDRGGQASLQWVRDGARHNIRLNGPLGRGVVRVTQDEFGARLEDSEQRVFEAANAEELLFRYTGWRLPITDLDWWVLGLPIPGVAADRLLDDTGRLQTLRQEGWVVRYEKYATVDGFDLPDRLQLTRAADASAPDMQVRLVIDHWGLLK